MKTVFCLFFSYGAEDAELIGIYKSADKAHKVAEKLGGSGQKGWSCVYSNPYYVVEKEVRV